MSNTRKATHPEFSAPIVRESDIPRDRYGRPRIIQPDTGDLMPYTRISTLCKALEDQTGLLKWYGRMTGKGIACNDHLRALAAVLDVDDDKQKWNGLVDEAMEAAGSTRRRNIGSALHGFMQMLDEKRLDVSLVGAELAGDVLGYGEAMQDIEVLAGERFVVVDSIMAAGTFDRLVRLPDGRVVIADIKTGNDPEKYAQATAVQVGLYANGMLYNPHTGERTPIHPDLDTNTGLLIVPRLGKGKTDLFLLDTSSAMSAATIATIIRDWRKAKVVTPYHPAGF